MVHTVESIFQLFQEFALYKEFTINETLHYFGRIHGMKKSDICNQIEFLISLLDLPDRLGTESFQKKKKKMFRLK